MMKEKIKTYYHKYLADSKVVRSLLRTSRRIKRKGKKIRIVFICQMPQLWNKMESVYQEMKNDEHFECCIYVVPDESIAEKNQQKSLEYFMNYDDNAIMAKNRDGWVSLEKMQPDYVFYQRPYDHYLPECYRSYTVAAYSRVCYISYSYACTIPVEGSCYNQAFFRNVYLFFAENEYAKNLIYQREEALYQENRKKVFYLGYPAMDSIINAKEMESLYWKEDEKSEYKILWCPRWTTDINLGASHFFEMKDSMKNFVKDNNDFSMVFRPHPMMFDNFIKTGEMTSNEVDEYLKEYTGKNRLYYDKDAEYYSTLWASDVLIADLTTVIIEYFVTGKPVIYCKTEIEYNDFMKQIISGCYCVGSWNEIVDILDMLAKGEDPLKQEREKIRLMLTKGNGCSSQAILEEMKKDYYLV